VTRRLSAFSDILRGRRSDLLWVTKEWRPQPVTQHARTRTPAKIRQDVVSSAKMQHTIEQVRNCLRGLDTLSQK